MSHLQHSHFLWRWYDCVPWSLTKKKKEYTDILRSPGGEWCICRCYHDGTSPDPHTTAIKIAVYMHNTVFWHRHTVLLIASLFAPLTPVQTDADRIHGKQRKTEERALAQTRLVSFFLFFLIKSPKLEIIKSQPRSFLSSTTLCQ